MLSSLNGGWTLTWQGDEESLYPKDKLTILRAIEAVAGAQNVTYVPGTTFNKEVDIAAAIAVARSADVVIAALGEKAYCETPGNIDDLTLDDAQLRLVTELAKVGKPMVLVLAEGRPRVIHKIAPLSAGIVMAYLPGMEGGRAIADVLFGNVNPSGKLPFTYPAFSNGLTTYDYKPLENANDSHVKVEFPFGYGLSYSKFVYSDLKLSNASLSKNGFIEVSVIVKNTGARTGKEVVQLYVSDLYRSVSPPIRELKGFQKIELQPGEAKTVSFRLTPSDLSFVGQDNKWMTEPGEFKASVSELEAKFTLQ
jgi:beta-glucosidase